MSDELFHYGTPRHSGRYPWGSGDNPYQHEAWFMNEIKRLRDKGMSDTEIAKELGMSTTVFRARRSVAKDELRAQNARQVLKLKDKGYSNVKIAEIMGITEGSVRNLLKPALNERANVTKQISDTLKSAVEEKGYIDVGPGAEAYLGISRTKLSTAVQLLEDEGYTRKTILVDQLGTDHKTQITVLAPPETTIKDIYDHKDEIQPPLGIKFQQGKNGTLTALNMEPPVSVDPKRVGVRLSDDGGADMDGVILVRRGVEDISLGQSRYAQVRILVGEDQYLKGMAMYSDDLPDGVDLLFNTNKSKADVGDNPLKALKKIKEDEDNPFGATVDQYHYIGKDGKDHLSAMNIVNEEGSWGEWKKTLSSQMLSKQPVGLAKQQLDLAYSLKKSEYEEIMALTNPTVRAKLLQSFADDCDSSAVDLKAAGMKRQGSHVILPFPDMKESEIYAPNYKDGETVVLIRFPHGGTFEIPQLTVNNKQPTAKKTLGDAIDAVGIHPSVAARLSGADFDGDTVLVIPNPKGQIKISAPLKGLADFNPSEMYKAYEGMPVTSPENGFHKQSEMGKVSNLITDMTIKGASQDEIAAAVRHSMVVIDAEKHNLDWRSSEQDNNIAHLKEKYQGKKQGGASTLISKASSVEYVPHRKQRYIVNDPDSKDYDPSKPVGAKIYIESGETYRKPVVDKKTGAIKEWKEVPKQTKSTKMAETDDAYTLSSGTQMESVYASYANRMKALANQARKDVLDTPSLKYDPVAKKMYSKEVESLDAQLNIALKNAPLERQAQIRANIVVAAKKKENPGADNDQIKKWKSQALSAARTIVGAKKTRIKPTAKEWEAIQAGAISNSKLIKILNNMDTDTIKALATPRQTKGMSTSKVTRAKALLATGQYTQAEVAEQLGVSVSTLRNAIKK